MSKTDCNISAHANLTALLAARPHSSLLDVYADPTLTDKLVISEQLKRIELLLERIVRRLEDER